MNNNDEWKCEWLRNFIDYKYKSKKEKKRKSRQNETHALVINYFRLFFSEDFFNKLFF